LGVMSEVVLGDHCSITCNVLQVSVRRIQENLSVLEEISRWKPQSIF
jgi:hypothetical protein